MLELRPLAPEDADALREIRAQPAVSRWWDPPEDDFPLGDDDESVRLTILHEGRVAGMIQFWEEPDPKYRHASVDLFLGLAPARAGARHRGGAPRRPPAHPRARPPSRGHRPRGRQPRGDPRLRQGGLQAGRGSCAPTSATPTAAAGTTACSWSSSSGEQLAAALVDHRHVARSPPPTPSAASASSVWKCPRLANGSGAAGVPRSSGPVV